MATKRPLAFVLALLTCAAPRVAWSEPPTAADKESARGMMDAGHAQRDAGHHDAALALFQGADAIMHVPTTGIEVAREQVALGRLVEARDTVQAVLRIPAASDEPGAFRAARRAAIALDDDLVKRIPSLRIDVSGNPTRVSVDGASVPLQALIGPYRVDPGHHVILATTAAGDARREVDVTEGQTVPVDLVAPAAASPAVQRAGGPADAGGSADDSAIGSAGPGSIVPWLRWGSLGLAAAGIGVGTVTGLMAISAKSSAENGCVNGKCPPATWSDIDSARTTSTISTIAFSAAGAGAALVVVSYLLPTAKSAAAPGGGASLTSTLTPWVGPVGAGVRGTF